MRDTEVDEIEALAKNLHPIQAGGEIDEVIEDRVFRLRTGTLELARALREARAARRVGVEHLTEVKAIAGEARARVREVEAELHAVLEERERCRTLLVRSQLVAEDVGVEEGSEDLDRAHDYLRDVRAYLHAVANA